MTLLTKMWYIIRVLRFRTSVMLSNCSFLYSRFCWRVYTVALFRFPVTALYTTLCHCLNLSIQPLEAFESLISNIVAMCRAFHLSSVPLSTALLCTRYYQKDPGLGKKLNAGLIYSVLVAVFFKIGSLGTYTVMPSFLLCFIRTVEAIFLNVVVYHLRSPLDVRHFQNIVHSVSFSILETNKNQKG